jgi:hypothetical protein
MTNKYINQRQIWLDEVVKKSAEIFQSPPQEANAYNVN